MTRSPRGIDGATAASVPAVMLRAIVFPVLLLLVVAGGTTAQQTISPEIPIIGRDRFVQRDPGSRSLSAVGTDGCRVLIVPANGSALLVTNSDTIEVPAPGGEIIGLWWSGSEFVAFTRTRTFASEHTHDLLDTRRLNLETRTWTEPQRIYDFLGRYGEVKLTWDSHRLAVLHGGHNVVVFNHDLQLLGDVGADSAGPTDAAIASNDAEIAVLSRLKHPATGNEEWQLSRIAGSGAVARTILAPAAGCDDPQITGHGAGFVVAWRCGAERYALEVRGGSAVDTARAMPVHHAKQVTLISIRGEAHLIAAHVASFAAPALFRWQTQSGFSFQDQAEGAAASVVHVAPHRDSPAGVWFSSESPERVMVAHVDGDAAWSASREVSIGAARWTYPGGLEVRAIGSHDTFLLLVRSSQQHPQGWTSFEDYRVLRHDGTPLTPAVSGDWWNSALAARANEFLIAQFNRGVRIDRSGTLLPQEQELSQQFAPGWLTVHGTTSGYRVWRANPEALVTTLVNPSGHLLSSESFPVTSSPSDVACLGDACMWTWLWLFNAPAPGVGFLRGTIAPGGGAEAPIELWPAGAEDSAMAASNSLFLPSFIFNNGVVDVLAGTTVDPDGSVGPYFAVHSAPSLTRLHAGWDGEMFCSAWNEGDRVVFRRYAPAPSLTVEPAIDVGRGTLRGLATTRVGSSLVLYENENGYFLRVVSTGSPARGLRGLRAR